MGVLQKKILQCLTVSCQALLCDLPSCLHEENPITQPAKGSRKPIRSRHYRDRFQIDLIDFCKLRKMDPFGVLMRWVMTIKDHATGLTYLCALPRKRPHLIAYNLQELFGIIGYPKIFHTDTGKEFTAKVVLKALREMNPLIYTVTGHPRCPSDQDYVESMNKLVKRILGTVLTERRLAGDNGPYLVDLRFTISIFEITYVELELE